MTVLRIQAAPIAFGFVVLAACIDRRAAARMAGGGLAGAMAFAGLPDWIALGHPFQSHFTNVTAQIVEGQAARFGVSPWHWYFPWVVAIALRVSPAAVPLAALGAVRVPGWAAVAAAFVGIHVAIGHKEIRFLWPAVPLALGIVAAGIERLWELTAGRTRAIAFGLISVSFAVGVPLRLASGPWSDADYRGSAEGLRTVGRLPDATGVAVGMKPPFSGNYFFLNRAIPLLLSPDDGFQGPGPVPLPRPGVNYMVAREDQLGPLTPWQPELVAPCSNGWGVYKVTRP
jgi:hypothetical protein